MTQLTDQEMTALAAKVVGQTADEWNPLQSDADARLICSRLHLWPRVSRTSVFLDLKSGERIIEKRASPTDQTAFRRVLVRGAAALAQQSAD